MKRATKPISKLTSSKPVKPALKKKITKDLTNSNYGTGRRKNAIARVWIKPGTGKIIVNNKDILEYFTRPVLRMVICQPFEVTKTSAQIDVFCTVKGGGVSGQAGALRHGISRALDLYNNDLHKTLRQAGFLTRDSRVVERKKYGRAKARKKFQFSKR